MSLRKCHFLMILLALSISGCATLPARAGSLAGTPFLPLAPTQVGGQTPSSLTAGNTPETAPRLNAQDVQIWIDPALPTALVQLLPKIPESQRASAPEDADVRLVPAETAEAGVHWVYALVAPFPTLIDDLSFDDVQAAWQGHSPAFFAGQPLLLAPETRRVFEALWGPAAGGAIREAPAESLVDLAWSEQPSWALIPFEAIQPRWKVLRVDGQSPFDRAFEPKSYPLVAGFSLESRQNVQTALAGAPLESLFNLPATNRDPQKLTVLVMTGVTALVRATGSKMEQLGMTYPGKDIRPWLVEADLTHVSNEVSFEPTCPPANPNQTSLMFCSRPEYYELLEDVGTDIVELTGNHLVDWRVDSLEYTLKLYQEKGMRYFGSGMNLEEARAPLLVEDHGNKLAFIGCNPAGPENVWATEERVGAASCDYDWMKAEIARLSSEGYLVIATLQYNEHYAMVATPYQQRDFPPLAEAGAVIVHGSQAHFPQTFTFVGDSFVHYGLGNLFFDQMDVPVKGTRREFIDRHVFYDGRYMGVELLTAMLEEYARPRPMTAEERTALLQEAFDTAGW